jgi:ketosteroid isomerase-like protein
MSEDENLAVVRRTIESFANDLETWLDMLDPAVKWYPQEEHHTLLLGRNAALRRRERWRETFQEGTYGLEIEELRGNGENVFSVLREWGRGRGSGIEVEDHDYAHWKVRNGKIVYCYEYGTRREALEAAGLSE